MPSGFMSGSTDTPILSDLNPTLMAGFGDVESFNSTYLVAGPQYDYYDYDLGTFHWRFFNSTNSQFWVATKVYWLEILWFGELDICNFQFEGLDRGSSITFTELDADEVGLNGTVQYDALHKRGGSSLIFSWNSTHYNNSREAWTDGTLVVNHGVSISSQSPFNVLSILLGLMFLQLPDVPFLIQVILATPIWASTMILLFFLITKLIPLLP